jgi:hypothetical protein
MQWDGAYFYQRRRPMNHNLKLDLYNLLTDYGVEYTLPQVMALIEALKNERDGKDED